MRTVLTAVGLALSVLSIGIVLSHVDMTATAAILATLRLPELAVAVALLAVQFVALTVRWRLLLGVATGDTHLPYRPVVEAMLVGVLANTALPARLGEVARTVVISRRGAVDLAGSAGTVILERILDVTVLCAVALVAAVLAGAPWFVSGPLAAATVAGLMAVVVSVSGWVPRILRRLGERFPSVSHRPRLYALMRWVGRLIDGLAGHHPRVMVTALLLTLASVLLDGAIFWAIGRGLQVELTWPQALVLATAGVLVTAIPSAPANVGTFELAVAAVGATLGVSTEDALAIALVAHGVIVIPLSIGGAVVLAASLRSPKPEVFEERPVAERPRS